MKKKNKIAYVNEIDLMDIILAMWEKRLTILIFILIFTILGYVYASLQPKLYQTSITLRPPSTIQFKDSGMLADEKIKFYEKTKSFNGILSEEFIINFQSLDNLINFVEQNKKLDLFKAYLEANNVSPGEYFSGKLRYYPSSNNELVNKFSLIYTEPLDGKKFLMDYVIYNHQIIKDSFKKMLVEKVKNNIKKIENHIEIAKKVNIENPVIIHSFDDSSNLDSKLYYQGYKVLGQKKKILNNLLNEILKSNFEFILIVDKPSDSNLISKSKLLFALTGSVIAIILLMIAFFVKTNMIFRK